MMNRFREVSWVFVCLVAVSSVALVEAQSDKLADGRGGTFDVTVRKIPLEEIRGGGPPRDGIPALVNPQFVSSQEADRFLSSRDRVLGVEFGGVSKAYPIKILNWHEVVNDEVSGRPIAVSW